MNPEDVLKQLIACRDGDDQKVDHSNADAILVAFVESLGFTEIAKVYREIDKWYA